MAKNDLIGGALWEEYSNKVNERMANPLYRGELTEEDAKLKNAKNIAILERTSPSGAFGSPLYNEIRSTLFDVDCKIFPFIVSLGGRETYPEDMEKIYEIMASGNEVDANESIWIGLR